MVMVYEGSALKHLARIGTTGRLTDDGPGNGASRDAGRDRDRDERARARTRREAGGNGRPSGGAHRRSDAIARGVEAHGVETGEDETAAGEVGPPRSITCGFCGTEFVEDRMQAACQACPLSKACALMRCPHCGYENAKEPGWITKIKEWIG